MSEASKLNFRVRLHNKVYAGKNIIFDTKTGDIVPVIGKLNAKASDGHYFIFPESGVWGRFKKGDKFYFFHNTNLYDLNTGEYEMITTNKAGNYSEFVLSLDNVVLEKIRYKRFTPDLWYDEEDLDIFRGLVKLHGHLKTRLKGSSKT